MLGILIYAFLAGGLACLLPSLGKPGEPDFGIRFAGGYALTVILFFLVHVVFQAPLAVAVPLLSGFAAVGAVAGLRRSWNPAAFKPLAAHPVPLLLVLGLAAVALNGGISYLPFTVDEFTNWLGVSRDIYFNGGYEAVRESVYLSGYTPGWRLMLVLPWQLSGGFDAGLSAAAPFVLHVGVAGIFYDLTLAAWRRNGWLPGRSAQLFSWALVLLFLAAEGMGKLWAFNLLIEQPQIYSLTALIFIIYASSFQATDEQRGHLYIGLFFALSYLLKAAALTFAPALALIAAAKFFTAAGGRGARLGAAAKAGLYMLGPALLAFAVWSSLVPSDAGLDSPLKTFDPAVLQEAFQRDWRGLAGRYIAAVWDYTASFKVVLTVAGVIAVAIACGRGSCRAPVAWGVFFLFYNAALYWFHLTVFGDYYFEVLNSIPRFTRVPLQVFHALGMLILVAETIAYLERRREARLSALVRWRWSVPGIAAVIMALGVWQFRQVVRSVEDVSTRRYQTVDPRIPEMERAALFIDSLALGGPSRLPYLVILDQGGTKDIVPYARYYAAAKGPGGRIDKFKVHPAISWSEKPVNVWQTKSTPERLATELRRADIIWPVAVDDWLLGVLGRLVQDPACLANIGNYALVRAAGDDASVRFRCRQKPKSRLP